MQVANFLLTGALYGGFALGLHWSTTSVGATRAISTFVGNVAAGLVLSGLFSTDPVSGYALAGAGFGQQPGWVDPAGLLQGISVCAGFGWLTSLAIRRLLSARQHP